MDEVDQIALDDCEGKCTFGRKSSVSNQGSHALQRLNSRVAKQEEQAKELQKKNEFFNSFLPLSSPLATSSPSHLNKSSSSITCGTSNSSDSGCGSSVIEETLKSSSIGMTLKNRKVPHECRNVTEELDGVLAKYHKGLACILGNTFLYGDGEERGKVSVTISEIVNLVMDAKETKKGLTELLLPPGQFSIPVSAKLRSIIWQLKYVVTSQ